MRVRDIMTWPVHTVRADDPAEQAAALLAEKSVTAAPVLDSDGRVVGMVSESDLLWDRVPAESVRAAPGTAHEPPAVVGEVMSTAVVAAAPEDDVAVVVKRMLGHDVRSLPVVDDETLVGIVSRRDILRTLVRTDDILCREVQHRLDMYAGHDRRWAATVHNGQVTIDGAFDDDIERRTVLVLARTVPGVWTVRDGDGRDAHQ
jgi:CBS domain-containing protein